MKRFYKDVTVGAVDGGFAVLLDGRPVKTPKRAPQIVPTRGLAEALAAEWAAQGETLDPRAFRFRDHADYALDIVGTDRAETIAQLLTFGETDTLCYRAEPGEALFRRQEERWEPLLQRLEAREGVRFIRISGVLHRPQPPESLAKLRERLTAFDDFTLGGLFAIVSLAASLVIGLEALEAGANLDELFALAELEEAWQAELWGRDAEAEARTAKRAADFTTAHEFLRLVRARR
ncbi:ATP12 family chaperone protein [Parerythrobacter lacustris]|uniref:Molecular chaperone n=1 Tax=Parerythrobacter lacustris TaxID=2969984 RepID=A0ABT1XVX9_9SPHN|nr:ATP12 family protein [Parerythrobacter lacustris]MCR2834825.1 molecular chaperone [Parerythrobacter lacustris]